MTGTAITRANSMPWPAGAGMRMGLSAMWEERDSGGLLMGVKLGLAKKQGYTFLLITMTNTITKQVLILAFLYAVCGI